MEAGQGEDWCACLCQKEGDSVLSRRTTEAGRSAEVRVHLDRCMAGCRSRSDCADACRSPASHCHCGCRVHERDGPVHLWCTVWPVANAHGWNRLHTDIKLIGGARRSSSRSPSRDGLERHSLSILLFSVRHLPAIFAVRLRARLGLASLTSTLPPVLTPLSLPGLPRAPPESACSRPAPLLFIFAMPPSTRYLSPFLNACGAPAIVAPERQCGGRRCA